MAGFARPTSTISNAGDWTANGAASLHEAIDETSSDSDSTYAASQGTSASADVSVGTFEVGLAEVDAPDPDTEAVRIVVYARRTGTRPGEFTAKLYADGAHVATLSVQGTTLTTSYAAYRLHLTPAHLAAIGSDWDSLSLRFEFVTSGIGGAVNIRVTQAFVEVWEPPIFNIAPLDLTHNSTKIQMELGEQLDEIYADIVAGGTYPILELEGFWYWSAKGPGVIDPSDAEAGNGLNLAKTGLSPETAYVIAVQYYYDGDYLMAYKAFETPAEEEPEPEVPAKPETPTRFSAGLTNYIFNASTVADSTGYEYRINGGTAIETAIVGGKIAVNSGLSIGTHYNSSGFQYRAYNAVGPGEWSDPVAFATWYAFEGEDDFSYVAYSHGFFPPHYFVRDNVAVSGGGVSSATDALGFLLREPADNDDYALEFDLIIGVAHATGGAFRMHGSGASRNGYLIEITPATIELFKLSGGLSEPIDEIDFGFEGEDGRYRIEHETISGVPTFRVYLIDGGATLVATLTDEGEDPYLAPGAGGIFSTGVDAGHIAQIEYIDYALSSLVQFIGSEGQYITSANPFTTEVDGAHTPGVSLQGTNIRAFYFHYDEHPEFGYGPGAPVGEDFDEWELHFEPDPTDYRGIYFGTYTPGTEIASTAIAAGPFDWHLHIDEMLIVHEERFPGTSVDAGGEFGFGFSAPLDSLSDQNTQIVMGYVEGAEIGGSSPPNNSPALASNIYGTAAWSIHAAYFKNVQSRVLQENDEYFVRSPSSWIYVPQDDGEKTLTVRGRPGDLAVATILILRGGFQSLAADGQEVDVEAVTGGDLVHKHRLDEDGAGGGNMIGAPGGANLSTTALGGATQAVVTKRIEGEPDENGYVEVELGFDITAANMATIGIEDDGLSIVMAATVLSSTPPAPPPIELEADAYAEAGAAGALSTAIPIAGAAVGVTSSAGSLTTGIALAATPAASATAAGVLTTAIPLAGDATVLATAAGNLTAQIRFAGDALAGALAGALLSTGISLEGAATAEASASANLAGAADLEAAAAGSADATGDLSTAIPIAGDAAGSSDTAGDLSTAIPIAGDAAGSSDTAGDLSTAIPIAGDASASATTTGSLTTTPGSLQGQALALALAGGALTIEIRLAGGALAEALSTAHLTTPATELAGSATAGASASGSLTTGIPLLGASLVSSAGAGALTTIIPLAGAAASVVAAQGSLDVVLRLEGAAIAVALAGGALTARLHLEGAALARSVATGALGSGNFTPAPSRTLILPVESRRITAAELT